MSDLYLSVNLAEKGVEDLREFQESAWVPHSWLSLHVIDNIRFDFYHTVCVCVCV